IAETMALFWPEATVSQIQTSINLMCIAKKLLVAPNPIKRTIVNAVCQISPQDMKGQMILPNPNPGCRHISIALYELFPEAVESASSKINEFENAVLYGTELSDDFHGNFSNRYN
ncbi:MAG: hypothetical protein IKN54_04940, partial [Lachnospiraceae bacterium]|nr:hypothetical protein [Lachnospiraceae bacterium]